MTRFMLAAGLLMLAACSGGDDKSETEDSAALSPLQKAEPAASDRPETVEESDAGPAAAPAETGAAPGDKGKAIPAAIRGRWALKPADCRAKKGSDLTALAIDATNLRFYESHGELVRVEESGADHIVADYRFSGEGDEWNRRMRLSVEDGGKTLVRRDSGEGAGAGPMRYTRCS